MRYFFLEREQTEKQRRQEKICELAASPNTASDDINKLKHSECDHKSGFGSLSLLQTRLESLPVTVLERLSAANSW